MLQTLVDDSRGILAVRPPGDELESRTRSGWNGLQEAGLQGPICSFLLPFIYSDALSLHPLHFSSNVEMISHRPPLRTGDDDFVHHALRKL